MDNRHLDARFPIADYAFAALTFPATASAALDTTLANINGTIKNIDIVATETEDNITYTVAITNANGATIFSEGSLADATSHYKHAVSHKSTQDADFNPAMVNGTLTVLITPSAAPDAGPVGTKTATVTVTIYLE